MLIVVTVYSAKEAVAAMIKRLTHRNANVQLYTLEVGSCSPASQNHCTVWSLTFSPSLAIR